MRNGTDLMYIGTYTGAEGEGEGVVAARRHNRGELESLGLAARAESPSFLARHPELPVLYAVSERSTGELFAWQVLTSGELRELGRAPTGGDSPCHLAVHPSGRYVFCANYGSGSVAVIQLDPDGAPVALAQLVRHQGRGPDDARQAGPHPHLVAIDESAAEVADLGADAVFHYRIDPGTGQLSQHGLTRTAPGTGPRHFAGHGDFRYLVGELSASIACYQVELPEGGWRQRSRLPVCGDGADGYPSEVAVGPDGRFVYVAVRGPDRIGVFDTDSGELRRVAEVPSGGQWPRHFACSGAELHVANERSHAVVTFRIDPGTGIPEPTGSVLAVPSPSCVFPFSVGRSAEAARPVSAPAP